MNPAAQAARQWPQQHERGVVDEFITLLSIRLHGGHHGNWAPNPALWLARLSKQGFFVTDSEPTAEAWTSHPSSQGIVSGGANAVRTPMDLAISQEVIRVVESAGPSIRLPNMGGGLPLTSAERPLGTRTIVIPIGNHDDNQHSLTRI